MCFISEESRFGEKYYRRGCNDINVTLNLNICKDKNVSLNLDIRTKQLLITERFSNVILVDTIENKYTCASVQAPVGSNQRL